MTHAHADGIDKKCALSGGMDEIIPILYAYLFLESWLHI
jgi:hypothetical protein